MSLDSTAMAAGEWWRAVTALTIHADEGHLVGNMVSLSLFGYAVCLAYGGGLAWALILASGIAGIWPLLVTWSKSTCGVAFGLIQQRD